MDKEKDKEKEKDSKGWYPGKYVGKAVANRRRSMESTGGGGGTQSAAEDSKLHTGSLSNRFSYSGINPLLENATPVGSITVSIKEIRYLRFEEPTLTMNLDRGTFQHSINDDNKTFEAKFDLLDVVSDLKISVVGKLNGGGKGGTVSCGVIIIPIPSLLSFTGIPKAPKPQWRMLLPVPIDEWSRPFAGGSDGGFKFASGYADLPGYALNRAKIGLGFLSVQVEVDLFAPAFQLYTMKSLVSSWKASRILNILDLVEAPSSQKALQLTTSTAGPRDTAEQGASNATTSTTTSSGGSLEDADASMPVLVVAPTATTVVLSNAELSALIQRDISRIAAVFRLPLSLSAFLSLPETVVVNMLLACLCFVLDQWQLPFAAVGVCFLNGFIFNSQRSFAHVIAWNDPIPPSMLDLPAAAAQSATAAASSSGGGSGGGAAATGMLNISGSCSGAVKLLTIGVKDPDGLPLIAPPPPSSSSSSSATPSGSISVLATTGTVGGAGAGVGRESVRTSDGGGSFSLPTTTTAAAAAAAGIDSGGVVAQAVTSLEEANRISNSDNRDGTQLSAASLYIRSLLQQHSSLSKIHEILSFTAHTAEICANALNFADSRASLVAYAFLFILAALTSFLLSLSPRLFAFVTVTCTTMLCACGALLLDCIDAKGNPSRQAAAGRPESKSVSARPAPSPMESVLSSAYIGLDCLAGYFSRIPDELELIHRHIAGLSLVAEMGSEMMDAANEYENASAGTKK